MSKLETSGAAQGLEEILASIRKSLDDESTKGLSKMSKPPAALAADARAPVEPVADGLSSRLAGALGALGASHERALADFFAHRPQKDQPAAAAPAAPTAKPVDAKDPIWFLTRPGAAGDGAAGKGETAPSPESDIASPSAPGEEVKLSRPETLRPSLPPLFSADRTVSSGAAPAAAQPAVKVAAARAENAAEQAAPPKGDRPNATLVSASAAEAASQPAPAKSSEAPSAAPGGAPGPALGELFAQLLEPVLVRWLDTNLPRMIESIVRAEVDKALARAR
jgi:cell pole-organizing protein PopZ